MGYLRYFQVLALLTFACISFDSAAQQSTSKINDEPKLLFLNYAIEATDSEVPKVTFLDKIIANGRQKDHSNKTVLDGKGDIECIQFDKNKKVLERTYIKNPLTPIVEYVNDEGAFEKRQLDLEHAEFPIKIQLNEATVDIRLMLVDNNVNATIELITTLIP